MKLPIRHLSIFTMFVILLLIGCRDSSVRKIKLASESPVSQVSSQNVSSVLRVSPEEQRSITVFYFRNQTRDKSLDWLQRGLTDMLITDLSQSPYLNVIPLKRLNEILKQLNRSEKDLSDRALMAEVARKANSEIFLFGQFEKNSDSLNIYVEIRHSGNEQLIRKEIIHGEGLENIFSMVDELSEKVRDSLRGKKGEEKEYEMGPVEMTNSVEAFRYYSEALIYQEKLMYAEAMKSLKNAVKADTTFATAYFRLWSIQNSFGEYDAANRTFPKVLRFREKLSDADQLRLQIVETQKSGADVDVVSLYEKAVNRFPNDTDFRFELAVLYRILGMGNQAFEEYQTILVLDPSRKVIYNELGYFFAYRGEFNTALKYINKYQQLAPDEPNPYDSKGEIIMLSGQLEDAAVQLKTAIAKWPQFGFSLLRLGQIYTELGNYEKASSYFNKFQNIEIPSKMSEEILGGKLLMYWRFGKIEKAEEILQKLINEKIPPARLILLGGEMYSSLGETAKVMKLYRSAFEKYQRIIDSEPTTTHIDNILLFVLESGLPPRELLPALEKMLKTDAFPPRDKIYYEVSLALVRLKAGESDWARGIGPSQIETFYDVLQPRRNDGWANPWKYIYWWADNDPENSADHHRISEIFLPLARQSGRKDLERMVRFARTRFYDQQGDREKVLSEYRSLGVAPENTWRVIGPFARENIFGFDYQFPPEFNIDLKAAYRNDGEDLRWRPGDDGYADGYMNLKSIFQKSNWTVGYGVLYAYSPVKRKVQIRLGTDEGCKLWLNDDLIWQYFQKRDALLDQHLVTVVLHPGYNKLLIKVTNTFGEWGYYLRITDENGDGFNDIVFYSPDEIPSPMLSSE